MKAQIFAKCLVLMTAIIAPAVANQDKFLGPRDIRGIKATINGYLKHKDTIFQYGNWYGPGWWGGARGDKPGNKPPVDSLDAIAQRHDFGYQVAEQQGKIYGAAEEKRLKGIADYLAVRDAKELPENPKDWPQPPADVTKASRYRDRMITGFAYEGPAYKGMATVGKGLDWATSPIENWELDRSHQLNASDLEKQVTRLQNNWDKTNAAPATTPTGSDQPVTPESSATDKDTAPEKTDKADATAKPANPDSPVIPEKSADDKGGTVPEQGSAPEKTATPDAAPAADSSSGDKQTTTDKAADTENETVAPVSNAQIESDPDYIELMRLSDEALALGNKAMAAAKSGKMPSGVLGRLNALKPRISTLGERLKRKYPNYGKNQDDVTDHKTDKNDNAKTDGQRGGTFFNKDGSKDVLHYETDRDGKEVAVWTTYDKSGKAIKQRREK